MKAAMLMGWKQALTTLRRLTRFSGGVLKGRLTEVVRIIQPGIMALRSNTSKLSMTVIQALPPLQSDYSAPALDNGRFEDLPCL